MKEVFISYKAEEYNEAMTVKQVLEANGISCWMAPESISGGSNYASEIPRAIRECTVFVLILSEQAQQSRWVPKELDRAINCGKTVLPFMLENCPLKDDFNFYLTNVQRYEAYANKSRALEQMVKEIKALIDAGRRGEEEDGASLSALPKEEAPPYEEKKEARSESAEKREGAPSFEETKRSSSKEEERSAPALKKEERSVPVKEAPAKKAPVKEAPAKKVPAGKTAEKKKKRRTGLVVGAIGAVVLCLLLALSGCIALAMQLDIIDRKITVGGERYSVNDLSPEFYGLRFTTDEAKKLPYCTKRGLKEGDFTYIVYTDKTARISKYSGSTEDLIIPEKIDGYTVTGIHSTCFEENGSLVKVTLPKTLKTIGREAFLNSSISELVILSPEVRVADSAFKGCVSLSKMTFEGYFADLGHGSFSATHVENIRLSPKADAIRDSALAQTEVKITDFTQFDYIGDSALAYTSLNASLNLTGVKEIGFGAFYRAGVLEADVTNVERIDAYAFNLNGNLDSKNVKGLSTVKSIDPAAFDFNVTQ